MPSKTSTPEEDVVYLLHVLKNCELPKPDFKQLAVDMKLANANNAQKKFKAIVERGGHFKLIDNQVIAQNKDFEAEAETEDK